MQGAFETSPDVLSSIHNITPNPEVNEADVDIPLPHVRTYWKNDFIIAPFQHYVAVPVIVLKQQLL